MHAIIKITLSTLFILSLMEAQQAAFQDPFIDLLVGDWIMKGTIAGRETIRDVTGRWVMDHQFLQLNERSREKNTEGEAERTYLTYIGWDQPTEQYTYVWFDLSGNHAKAGGSARRNGNELPFIIKQNDGSISYNTLVYDRDSDSWKLLIDIEKDGHVLEYERVRLIRK